MTLSDLYSRFQGHDIIQRQITRKWYKIELYLQWQTNRKSHKSIERRHFQWPWTTPNLVFKVTSFFDTQYLTNGYRYGHGYYRRRIRNPTQAFEWHQFQWHWLTSNSDFKVTILFNVKKTWKWYKIKIMVQWLTNRKSHVVYRTAPFSITLNDP